MKEVFIVFAVAMILFGMGYDLGRHAGYDRALTDIAEITPPPKTTDQQCVAWLFESTMKDVKKKVCK